MAPLLNDDFCANTSSQEFREVEKEVEVPHAYLCPLTLEIMTDPLMSRHGHSFERNAILEWMNRGNFVCPLTKHELTPSGLIPNTNLREEIMAWRIGNGEDQNDVVQGNLANYDSDGRRQSDAKCVMIMWAQPLDIQAANTVQSFAVPADTPRRSRRSSDQRQQRQQQRRSQESKKGLLRLLKQPFRSNSRSSTIVEC